MPRRVGFLPLIWLAICPLLVAAAGGCKDVKDPVVPVELVKTWGNAYSDGIWAIAVEPGGNIYCAGKTGDPGTGRDNVLLLKYDPWGVLQWVRSWGNTNFDSRTFGAATDSSGSIYCAGEIYASGSGDFDALLLKYDSSGSLLWVRAWGGADDEGFIGAVIDSSDNIYCAGETLSFGASAGQGDAMLLKYDASGMLQWARTWGGIGSDVIWAIAIGQGDSIYCAGETDSFSSGPVEALLLKYDSSGTLEWARTWSEGDDVLRAVTVDSVGNIYCAGWTATGGAGVEDTLLLKYDSAGTLKWARTWCGAADSIEWIFGVAADSAGNVYCAGFESGGVDVLLLMYDSSGTLKWAKVWRGTGYEMAFGVEIDSGDNVYLGGYTASYTGAWQTITTGIEGFPSGTESAPSGSESTPAGIEGSPAGTEGRPTGSETGAGGSDALLLKNWR